ncbi:MAG TPA: shikimate kinase [Thermoplasmata archaeon]|nr:shikimate kinase [Thermoplasmata archaeon]
MAQASCFGAGTIVNAIATGKGAAFGLAFRVTATAHTRAGRVGVQVDLPDGLDPALVRACVQRVRRRTRRTAGIEVTIDSEIPVSRGLKSSSAVANAVVLACARALGAQLEPLEIIGIGVDAAFDAGVTITGAFDDACASFFGGIVATDNRARKILVQSRFPEGLLAIVQVPNRTITKPSLKDTDFVTIRPQVEEAFRLALSGDFFGALEANSAAYAPLLGVDEAPAIRARAAGAKAAGITGTGPAILALADQAHMDGVRRAMDDGSCEVRVVSLNTVESREVIV